MSKAQGQHPHTPNLETASEANSCVVAVHKRPTTYAVGQLSSTQLPPQQGHTTKSCACVHGLHSFSQQQCCLKALQFSQNTTRHRCSTAMKQHCSGHAGVQQRKVCMQSTKNNVKRQIKQCVIKVCERARDKLGIPTGCIHLFCWTFVHTAFCIR